MGNLYDIDRKLRKIKLKETEEAEILQAGTDKIATDDLTKMIETVDTALRGLKPSVSSKLTWTSCGALLGYDSDAPEESTNYLWTKAYEAFLGHRKSSNIFVGCLLRWRLLLLAKETNNNWFTVKQETDGFDYETGTPITRSTYWINNDFVV